MNKLKTPSLPTKAGGLESESGVESSLTLILKELNKNKEAERKEAAAEAMRTRCKTCFREIAPFRKCGGHGGGGGGGSTGSGSTSEDKASKDDSNSLVSKSGHKKDDAGGLANVFDFMGGDGDFQSSDEENFNAAIIEMLIANGLLMVESDRQSKTLTIEFDPNSLSEEQRLEVKKFIKAILKELNEFKVENHISDECFKIVEKGNLLSLQITLPTLALYDAFIHKLANNLVPMPNPELEAKDTKEQNLVPNPLAMEPKPSSNKPNEVEAHKVAAPKEKEDEEQKTSALSPFKMTPY